MVDKVQSYVLKFVPFNVIWIREAGCDAGVLW